MNKSYYYKCFVIFSGPDLRRRHERHVRRHFRLRRKSQTLGHLDRTLHPRHRVAQEGVPD